MYISNKHGYFNVNAAQYNYLMATFAFNDITPKIVSQTTFINSSYEYEKADKLFKATKQLTERI